MTQVNILDARNRLSQLIKSAASGEEIVIANRGVPVARLVALPRKSRENATAGTITDWLEQHPLPEYARRSSGEIEASTCEERDSWE